MAITLGTDGYCVEDDVQALFGQRTLSTSSVPTLVQLASFITQGFNLIDGVLHAAGYSTPVAVTTYTRARDILREINANYAGSKTHMAAFSAGVGGVPEQAAFMMQQFEARIADIQKGRLALPDAPTLDRIRLLNDGDPAGEFNVDDDGNEIDPSFTRDMPL